VADKMNLTKYKSVELNELCTTEDGTRFKQVSFYNYCNNCDKSLSRLYFHPVDTRFHKRKPRWGLEKLYDQRQVVHDRLEEKLGAIKCESVNVEVQWNNIKKCVLDTMSDGWKSREESKKDMDYTGDDQ
jgi:hypothetical protein